MVQSTDTMSPAMADAHAYHDWVFSSFASRLLPGRTLEVGSGHGRYARRMARVASRLVVSDIDPTAIERIQRELQDLDNVEYLVMPGVQPEKLSAPVDNLVLVNVLEHIADDAGTLRACRDALAATGRLIVFVPAFPALYSRMDEQAGHHRRYTKSGLVQLVEDAGFAVQSARYFNAVGFFGWFANRLTGSTLKGAGTNAQIRVFNRLLGTVKWVDRVMPFIGQSLVVVASRR